LGELHGTDGEENELSRMSPSTHKRTKKRLETLAKNTVKAKAAVLEQLAQYPVVTNACKRASVGRATYYKWLESDAKFARSVEQATIDGKRFVTDMAKAQLLKLMSNGDKTAIIFLLKNYDPDFTDKVRYLHEHRHKHTLKMSKDDREAMKAAIHNVGLSTLMQSDDEEIDIG
jgi:ABC-type cobalamin/Fe3+-siderophores transport system ATPase subunit